MTQKYTDADIRRMAGFLLSDPTRHAEGRHFEATDGRKFNGLMQHGSLDSHICAWCYWGAIIHCAAVLKHEYNGWSGPSPRHWDKATTAERLEMARQLREST